MNITTKLFIGVVLFGFILFGYQHEKVHVDIFGRYGIDSEVDYFNIKTMGMSVTPEKPCPTEECMLSNSINDAIGYHLLVLYFLISMGLFFIIVLLDKSHNIEMTRTETFIN